jgi:hypothetical protein
VKVRNSHAVVVLLAAALVVAACGTSTTGTSAAGASHPPTTPPMGDMAGMTGMDDMPGMSAAPSATPPAEAAPTGDGLAATVGGYTFVPGASTVPVGAPSTFSFHISGPGGHAVTRYQPYQGELVLVDLVRSDLIRYSHLDPAMREDGTWSVALPALPSGSYRAYVTFAAPDVSAGTPLVYELSRAITVPGNASGASIPAPVSTADVDGFAVTLSGQPRAGVSTPLTIGVTHGGKPVAYFQRYLDGYAHVTAFRAGTLAFAHLTPANKTAGQKLTTTALFPAAGTWRVYVRFVTDGPPHTAAFTVDVP